MSQVTVTIAGKIYRMACGEGEEAHLQELARQIDTRMESLKKNFGEIGDQRLTIMAAITIADQLAEANRRNAQLEVELLNLKSDASDQQNSQDQWADRLADTLVQTATRIERVAQELTTAAHD